MSKSVPDRWLEYKPYGTVIDGTKILPFKVPLKEAVLRNLGPEERFSTTSLLQAFPRLKYIIDLTNTRRYYDEEEFTSRGVKYEKLMIPGREIPPTEMVNKFFETMDEFTSACGEDEIVGVHCTHGINRTGYLICRYLIQQLNWECDNCLKAFEKARGYAIERQIYVNALSSTPRQKVDISKLKVDKSIVRLAPETSNWRSMPLAGHARRTISPFKMPRYHVRTSVIDDASHDASPQYAFAKDGPYSRPPFVFGGSRPTYRPIRPSMNMPLPPRPGFLIPDFSSPCPSRTRLAQVAPTRLPPSKMPSPRYSQSVPRRPVNIKRLKAQKRRSNVRNGVVAQGRNPVDLISQNSQMSRRAPKLRTEQDFTIDTFEENLLAVSSQPNRR